MRIVEMGHGGICLVFQNQTRLTKGIGYCIILYTPDIRTG